jgi:hypothetical protein|tara:strand:+ start:96 stop:452 length:357 start_codon:yes stop_codon:yes gene_type:complete
MELCDLQSLGDKYPFHKFTIVIDFKEFVPEEIISWRGSYDTPAILYSKEGECTGEDFSRIISNGIYRPISGYKGGEYTFFPDHVPYLTPCDSANNYYQITAFCVSEDEVTLLTEEVTY